eukprot:202418-Chlamydomonas_euryale.AAC.1
MQAAWRGPCSNRGLSVLWRAAINCLPGERCNPSRCSCGALAAAPATAREYTLWDCPVAYAVTSQMDGALGAASPAPLARADVWLLRPPC